MPGSEYLEQADADFISTATTTATAQLLNTKQSEAFVRLLLSKQALLSRIPPSNVLFLDRPDADINRISWGAYNSRMGLGELAEMPETDYAVPTFDARPIDPEPIELHTAVSLRMLLDNIEREGFLATLNDEIALAFGNDIEYAAIQGDTSEGAVVGVPTGLNNTIDGFRVKLADGNVVDHAGGFVTADLLQDMVEALDPEVLMTVNEGHVFFVPVLVREAWVRVLQSRATDLGDMSLIAEGVPAYRGIPLVGCPHMPITEDGVAGTSMSGTLASFSYIFLCNPNELFVGFNPQIRRHQAVRNTDGKVVNIHLYSAFDVQVRRPEWTSLAYNVRPSIS